MARHQTPPKNNTLMKLARGKRETALDSLRNWLPVFLRAYECSGYQLRYEVPDLRLSERRTSTNLLQCLGSQRSTKCSVDVAEIELASPARRYWLQGKSQLAGERDRGLLSLQPVVSGAASQILKSAGLSQRARATSAPAPCSRQKSATTKDSSGPRGSKYQGRSGRWWESAIPKR